MPELNWYHRMIKLPSADHREGFITAASYSAKNNVKTLTTPSPGDENDSNHIIWTHCTILYVL